MKLNIERLYGVAVVRQVGAHYERGKPDEPWLLPSSPSSPKRLGEGREFWANAVMQHSETDMGNATANMNTAGSDHRKQACEKWRKLGEKA
jgi:hypothetical protein